MAIALARKYRPRTLKELIGQEETVRSITDSIVKKKLHHAYVFFGTRGIGKTSIARVMAKSINCRSGITKEPCQKCISCKEIDEGCFIDLIEIDAASNTKVDEFRDLLENISKSPVKGKYKVYIIDEVHMLSKYSFNALLKTLEEPPEHCIFILATTSIKQVPATILSRCLRFPLKAISNRVIAARLVEILQKENITFDVEGIKIIVDAAKGSMRDALSLLEQTLVYREKAIFAKDVKKMLGTIDEKIIIHLLKALQHRDEKHLLKISNKLCTEEVDFHSVISDIISLLHKIAVIQALPEMMTKENNLDIISLAKKIPKNDVHIYYQIAISGKYDLMYSNSLPSAFEMLLLRMLALTSPKFFKKNNSIIQKKSLESTVFSPKLSNNQVFSWLELINKIRIVGPAMVLAQHCKLLSMNKQTIKLAMADKYSDLLQKEYKQNIENAICSHYGGKFSVHIELENMNNFFLNSNQEKVKEISERFDAKITI